MVMCLPLVCLIDTVVEAESGPVASCGLRWDIGGKSQYQARGMYVHATGRSDGAVTAVHVAMGMKTLWAWEKMWCTCIRLVGRFMLAGRGGWR